MKHSRRSKLEFVVDWMPAAFAVVMIALESTATMSADNTSRWLYPLWVKVFGPISESRWGEVHHLIRKSGHFAGYGVVSLAFFVGCYRTLRSKPIVSHLHGRASLWAVGCTLLIAILDEVHQSFLPNRTSSPVDVGIDLCGAITAQLLLLGIVRLLSRRN